MTDVSEVEARFLKLRNNLDSGGYVESFGPDSLRLVEHLYNDLVKTTDSLQKTLVEYAHYKKIAEELEDGVLPFKEENVRLYKENSQLRMGIAKAFEEAEDKTRDPLSRLRDLEAENNDLKLLVSQFAERVKKVEIESLEKTKRIIRLQEKDLAPSVLTSVDRGKKEVPVQPTMELGYFVPDACPQCIRLRNYVEYGKCSDRNPKSVDYIKLADSRIEALQLQVRSFKNMEKEHMSTISTLKGRLETRDGEIEKLRNVVRVRSGNSNARDFKGDRNIEIELKSAEMKLQILQLRNIELEEKLKKSIFEEHENYMLGKIPSQFCERNLANIYMEKELDKYPSHDKMTLLEKLYYLEQQLSHCCKEKAVLQRKMEECRLKHLQGKGYQRLGMDSQDQESIPPAVPVPSEAGSVGSMVNTRSAAPPVSGKHATKKATSTKSLLSTQTITTTTEAKKQLSDDKGGVQQKPRQFIGKSRTADPMIRRSNSRSRSRLYQKKVADSVTVESEAEDVPSGLRHRQIRTHFGDAEGCDQDELDEMEYADSERAGAEQISDNENESPSQFSENEFINEGRNIVKSQNHGHKDGSTRMKNPQVIRTVKPAQPKSESRTRNMHGHIPEATNVSTTFRQAPRSSGSKRTSGHALVDFHEKQTHQTKTVRISEELHGETDGEDYDSVSSISSDEDAQQHDPSIQQTLHPAVLLPSETKSVGSMVNTRSGAPVVSGKHATKKATSTRSQLSLSKKTVTTSTEAKKQLASNKGRVQKPSQLMSKSRTADPMIRRSDHGFRLRQKEIADSIPVESEAEDMPSSLRHGEIRRADFADVRGCDQDEESDEMEYDESEGARAEQISDNESPSQFSENELNNAGRNIVKSQNHGHKDGSTRMKNPQVIRTVKPEQPKLESRTRNMHGHIPEATNDNSAFPQTKSRGSKSFGHSVSDFTDKEVQRSKSVRISEELPSETDENYDSIGSISNDEDVQQHPADIQEHDNSGNKQVPDQRNNSRVDAIRLKSSKHPSSTQADGKSKSQSSSPSKDNETRKSGQSVATRRTGESSAIQRERVDRIATHLNQLVTSSTKGDGRIIQDILDDTINKSNIRRSTSRNKTTEDVRDDSTDKSNTRRSTSRSKISQDARDESSDKSNTRISTSRSKIMQDAKDDNAKSTSRIRAISPNEKNESSSQFKRLQRGQLGQGDIGNDKLSAEQEIDISGLSGPILADSEEAFSDNGIEDYKDTIHQGNDYSSNKAPSEKEKTSTKHARTINIKAPSKFSEVAHTQYPFKVQDEELEEPSSRRQDVAAHLKIVELQRKLDDLNEESSRHQLKSFELQGELERTRHMFQVEKQEREFAVSELKRVRDRNSETSARLLMNSSRGPDAFRRGTTPMELEREIGNLRAALASLDRDKDEMRAELDRKDEKLARVIQDSSQYEDEISKLKLLLKNAELQISHTGESAKEQNREADFLKKQLENTRRDLEKIIRERDDALKELHKVSGAHAKGQLERRSVESELELKNKEADDLRKQVQRYIDEVRRIEELLLDKEEEMETLIQHYKSLTIENTNLEAQRTNLEKEASSIRDSVKDAVDQNITFKNQLVSQGSLVQSLEQEIQRFTQQISKLENQLANKSEKEDIQSQDLKASKDLLYRLEVQMDKLKLDLADSDSKRKQLEIENAELAAHISSLESRLQEDVDRQQQLEALVANARDKDYRSERNALNISRERDELAEKLTNIQQRSDALNSEVSRYRLKSIELQSELDRTRRQLDNEKRDRESAISELRRTREQLHSNSANYLIKTALGSSGIQSEHSMQQISSTSSGSTFRNIIGDNLQRSSREQSPFAGPSTSSDLQLGTPPNATSTTRYEEKDDRLFSTSGTTDATSLSSKPQNTGREGEDEFEAWDSPK